MYVITMQHFMQHCHMSSYICVVMVVNSFHLHAAYNTFGQKLLNSSA